MFSSTIKPYKFVNPSSISSGGGGATIIAAGKNITSGITSQVKSSRVTLLAINRIGLAMESTGKVQKQIRDIITYENTYLIKSADLIKKRAGYIRDQKSEEKSESFGKKEQDGVSKEVIKKEKKELGWLEKIFGPFAGIISFVGQFIVTQTILKWMSDPKNGEKLVVFVKSITTVLKWAVNIAMKSTDAVLTGFAKVFGSSDKKGLDRFGEVLGGLGSLLIGIAGFKALGYLLNPFSLVNDIVGLVELLNGKAGKPTPGADAPVPGGEPKQLGKAATKVGQNYGNDAGRFYDDLINRGKTPAQALKAVKEKFSKVPVKPKGMLDKGGDLLKQWKNTLGSRLGDAKSGILKGWDNIKMLGGSITKGMRDQLAASGKWVQEGVSKKLTPIAKGAYDLLEKKGIISMAKKAGNAVKGAITKIPGYDKVAKKVAAEGGMAMLGKLGGKAIPIIGGLVNLYFAYDRFKNGDKSGAALEALSGILDLSGLFGFAPGPMISMALDAYLFGRDFFPDVVKNENKFLDKMIAGVMGPLKSIQDSLPKIPQLAEGGIVDKPTRAIIGEDGPEAIIPLDQIGDIGGTAGTLIGATESALSRMGAAGEIARTLIGGDLKSAAEMFGASSSGGVGGDSLGKSVNKGQIKSLMGLDQGEDISEYIGDGTVSISDKKNSGNKATTLRGQLANILSALIWVSKKNLSGGGSNGGGSGGSSGGGAGSDDTSSPPGAVEKGKWAGLLNLILKYEAGANGYESMYPSTKLPGATKMTIAQVASRASGAVGAWQNLPEYLNQRAKAVGLNPTKDLYNAENQRLIAEYLIGPGQGNVSVDMAKKNPKRAMLNLSRVWAAIPKDDSGKSFYSGDGVNVAHIKPKQVYDVFAKLAKGGVVNTPSAFKSREQKQVIAPLMKKVKENNYKKFAAGGSHRSIPNTPETSWSAGIPLTYVNAKGGKSAEVAVPLAKRFQGFIRDLESTGYKINELGGFRADGPPSGNKDGKGPLYSHPYGAAIDINWTKNPAFVGKRVGDFPTNSGEIAAKYGLGWGTKFDDAMHFSAMKREYGAGIDGNEISAKSLGASKSGGDYDPKGTTGGDSGGTTKPEEEKEVNPFKALEAAVSALRKNLGYDAPAETPAEKLKPNEAPKKGPAPAATPKPKPTATGSTPAAISSGSQMSNASRNVATMKEAADSVRGAGQIIPLPINNPVSIPSSSGTQVSYPRSPITYGI